MLSLAKHGLRFNAVPVVLAAYTIAMVHAACLMIQLCAFRCTGKQAAEHRNYA